MDVTFSNKDSLWFSPLQVKVPKNDDQKLTVTFLSLLIRHCQAEFQKNHSRDDTICQQKEEHQRVDEAKASRSVSNIKFIAELFRLKMLSEAAIHSCIQRLLNNKDDESLECLCHLLNNIGRELELQTAKRVMDKYFSQVSHIIKEGKTKVSGMLKDTACLRRRNWMPGSREKDEIYMEDESPNSPSSALQPSSEPCIVPQTSAVEPSSSESAVCKEEPALPPQDADSSSANQPIQDTEDSHLSNKLKQDNKRDDNSQLEMKQEETGQTLSFAPIKPSLTEDEMENFSEVIVDDYLRTNDLKEALQLMSLLKSPSVLHVFVRNAVDLTFECSSRTRRQTGLLLLELMKSGVLNTEQFFRGLKEILEVADYISADVPEIWLRLAEVLSPVLHEGGVSMAEFFGKIKTLVPLGPAGVLLAHILTMLSSRITQKDLKVMWNTAGFKWEDFLHSGDDVEKFKADWKLQYTESEFL